MDGSFGGFTGHRKGFRQEVVKRLSPSQALFEFIGFRPQGLVAQRLGGGGERIDGVHQRFDLFDRALVLRAEKYFKNRFDHGVRFSRADYIKSHGFTVPTECVNLAVYGKPFGSGQREVPGVPKESSRDERSPRC